MHAVHCAYKYVSTGGAPHNSEKCFQYLLTRLLIGSMSIEKRGKHFKQTIDFSKITPKHRLKTTGRSAFQDFLADNGMGLTPRSFVQTSLADNRQLYQELLFEFTEFFWHSHIGCHASAFVYLYRALERASFSFPLIYCSIERDYRRTYKTLRSFFQNEESGELTFLKSLILNTEFIDTARKEVMYDIDFSSINMEGEGKNKLIAFARNLSNEWTIGPNDAPILRIKFKDIHDLFVTTRNRFLHARTGDGTANIQISKIGDLDDFFEPLNHAFCSYVALISLETMVRKYRKI